MNKWRFLLIISISLSFGMANFAHAHPGSLDYRGCHVCETNCSYYGLLPGQYHCHTPGYTYDGSCEYIYNRPMSMAAIEGQYRECLYKKEMEYYKTYTIPTSTPAPTPIFTPILTPILTPTPFDADASCKSEFGLHSFPTPNKPGYCSCLAGYQFNPQKQCVLIPTQIPTPSPVPSPTPTAIQSRTPIPTPSKTPTPTIKPARTRTPSVSTLVSPAMSATPKIETPKTHWYKRVLQFLKFW